MKKLLLGASVLIQAIALNAQKNEHVTAGVLGAANLAKYKIEAVASSADPGYGFSTDGMAGFWVNVPLSRRFSLEPQVNFVTNKMVPDNGTLADFNGKTNYVAIPLLLKIHLHKYVAIPLGPQLNLRTSVKSNNPAFTRSSFNNATFALTGGLEILPEARVTLFGRYVHDLTKANASLLPSRAYDQYNQNIQAGLKIKFFEFGKKKEVIPPPPPPPPADTDGDGIIDSLDKCPTVPGIAKYEGCPIPDTDKDGINDEEDKCPTVPGLAKYQGCPIPDTDGDGINDEEDKCPTVAGIARYQGCPIPDTDGDGVNDEEDKCITIPGPKENFGCPIIPEEVKKRVNVAAKNILFVTGSAKLQKSSFKGLDDVVKIMSENPGMSLKIDGHTDNVGKDDYNQTLSENRAAAVKTYLVSKGIDESRIASEGHGETTPIADNKTAAGRQQNRRSELTLSYYK